VSKPFFCFKKKRNASSVYCRCVPPPFPLPSSLSPSPYPRCVSPTNFGRAGRTRLTRAKKMFSWPPLPSPPLPSLLPPLPSPPLPSLSRPFLPSPAPAHTVAKGPASAPWLWAAEGRRRAGRLWRPDPCVSVPNPCVSVGRAAQARPLFSLPHSPHSRAPPSMRLGLRLSSRAASSVRTTLAPPARNVRPRVVGPPAAAMASAAAAATADPLGPTGPSGKTIATHSGSFHCDEALGCYLLRCTDAFAGARIVRSRDPDVLKGADVVIDVGAVYDPGEEFFFFFRFRVDGGRVENSFGTPAGTARMTRRPMPAGVEDGLPALKGGCVGIGGVAGRFSLSPLRRRRRRRRRSTHPHSRSLHPSLPIHQPPTGTTTTSASSRTPLATASPPACPLPAWSTSISAGKSWKNC
jgi:hypothetical protein